LRLEPSDQTWPDFQVQSRPNTPAGCRRSPFSGPLARCTFAAADTAVLGPAPTRISISSGDDTVAALRPGAQCPERWPGWPLRPDRRDRVSPSFGDPRSPTVAQVARRRLGARLIDKVHRRDQPRSCQRAGRDADRHASVPRATAAANGTPKAATMEVADRLFNALKHPVLLPRIRLAARRQLHAAASCAAPTRPSCLGIVSTKTAGAGRQGRDEESASRTACAPILRSRQSRDQPAIAASPASTTGNPIFGASPRTESSVLVVELAKRHLGRGMSIGGNAQ